MKRILLLSALALFLSTTSWAYDFSLKNDDGVTIYYTRNGLNVSVTNLSRGKYSGVVVIPEKVESGDNTYTVTGIAEYAFAECSGLTEVIIPNSVTSIGNFAFQYCTGLTEIAIPESVGYIGGYCFRDCTGLTKINYNAQKCELYSSITSSQWQPFYGCTNSISITIGENVATIPKYLFSGCTGTKEINFNATACATVGSGAFTSCKNISTASIGDNVTIIPSGIFSECSNLTSLILPENIISMDGGAFSKCTGLTELNYNATACESAGSSSSPVFSRCTNLAKITIGSNVTRIPDYLFYGCTGISEELEFSNQLTYIGNSAFYNCESLTGVNVSRSVTDIGENAFELCTGLTHVTIGNNVTGLGNNIFSGCSGITEVNYNATACESAGSSSSPVFSGCTSVVNLIIGENVAAIPEYTFQGCTNLTDITMLGGTPPTIYGTTFANVTDVAVPKEALNKYALADIWTDIPRIYANSNGNVYYPVPISYEGAVAITAVGGDENGTEALAGNTVQFSTIEGNNLAYGLATHVAKDITEELVNTGSYFLTVSEYHKENTICCYSPEVDNIYDITVQEAGQVLNEITVSKINSVYSLKVTGDINGTDITTIRRMTNLTTLDLSDVNVVRGGSEYYDTYTTSDNQIGSYFFYDMASLKTVVLPGNVTSIGSYAFGDCTDLTVITIPESVTSVANDAFSGSTSLAIVTLEDGVNTMSLSTSAFNRCPIATLHVGRKLNYSSTSSLPFANLTTLTTLTISDEVESVINSEYYGCSGLASLTIGDGVTSIGSSAFYGCASLTEATIGSRVKAIGSNAFNGGVSLAVINSKNPTPPDIESNTFNNVDKETCVLNIPTGSLNDYWLDRYWGEFLNINDNLPNAIREIVNSNGGAEAVGYYTTDGKQVPTLRRGVNIIRYSDGTAKKVLLK